MKQFVRRNLLIGLALLSDALCAAPIEGMMVIANKSVPLESISPAMLKNIYTGKTTYWSNGQSVVIATLDSETDTALREISGMSGSQFKTFWQRLVFSGRGQQPKKADSITAIVALVGSTKGAIALVPSTKGLKEVKTVEIN